MPNLAIDLSVGCYDCGLPYEDDGWVDVVVPNDVWLQISPTGNDGGLLCFTCMTRRLVELGVENVRGVISSGPWATEVVN